MSATILCGDVRAMLATLPDDSVSMVCTSPPYWSLRSYSTAPQIWGGDPECAHEWGAPVRTPWANEMPGPSPNVGKNGPVRDRLKFTGPFCLRCDAWRGELGSEPDPWQFIANLVEVFRHVRRVLHPTGVAFVNLGDSYSGSGKGPSNSLQRPASCLNDRQLSAGAAPTAWVPVPAGIPPKNAVLIPERFVLAMQEDGWIVRARLPWLKANCMPESVRDRPASAVEWMFMFSKSRTYFWDAEAVRKDGREWTGNSGTFARPNSKNGVAHVPGRIPQNRPDREDRIAPGRSFRNSDLWWSHVEAIKAGGGLLLDEDGDPLALLVNPTPFPGTHFATFSPNLVSPLIRAGTSERGVCPRCLAPWRRLTSKTFVPQPDVSPERNGYRGKALDRSDSWRAPARGSNETTTTGWAASCPCDAGPPRPAVVLDCFAGAGTTGLVADRLGRDSVLIELNPDYAEMARKRIDGDAPLLSGTAYEPKPGRNGIDKQGDLGKRTYSGFNARWDAAEAARAGNAEPEPPANGQAALPWGTE